MDQDEIMKIEELNPEKIQRYKQEIAQFYYDNAKSCSCSEHFTFEEALKKIDDFKDHLKKDECLGYGIFNGNEICGFIWAYPHQFREEKRMYINEIHIKKEYRNNGFGKALLKLVEKKAKEKGIGALYLHAEANNAGVIKLYEALGYIEERIQLKKAI